MTSIIEKIIPTINVYDISKDYLLVNSWNAEDSFPYIKSSKEIKKIIDSYCVIEIVFEGTQGETELFENLFLNYYSFLNKLILESGIPSYEFISEFKLQKINRLRSYKGIIPKNILKEDYIQSEILFNNGLSLIAALMKIDKLNLYDRLKLFTDNTTSFILSSTHKNIYTKEALMAITKDCMRHDGRTSLNYINLLQKFYDTNPLVYRIGGDGGDRYISLQIFCPLNDKELLLSTIKNVILSHRKRV
jgi:hypothetical protein